MPSPAARLASGLSAEATLATAEIQGHVAPGFATRFLDLVFVAIEDPEAARSWLRSLPVPTMADLLRWRARGDATGQPWLSVAFTYPGLAKLRPDADRMTDLPFKQGMARRSALLGDPTAADAPGSSANWLVGGSRGRGVDALVIVGYDRAGAFDAPAFGRDLPAGVDVLSVHAGATRAPPLDEHEPFGFRDDISQPGLRGRLPTGGYYTARENPADPNHGKPGQQLVWPGEFVFGYPGQDPLDKNRPGPVTEAGPPWAANGSLLVFRRLRQDVAGFHRFLAQAAADLAGRHPALAGLTADGLGAKLMGRWPSGAPVVAAPDADHPALAADPATINDFSFAAPSAGPAPAAGNGRGDPLGILCPRAAHIRRAYPRGAVTSTLSEANTETHRLLRRSVPYRHGESDAGIFFLAYQTSFERQFEHVQRAWLNNPHLHDAFDGHDPIAGQSFGSNGDRSRMFAIPVRAADGGVERIALEIPGDWVTPTGGGYFFTPSVTMLRKG